MSYDFAKKQDTPMGRLDPRLKLALGFSISVLSVLVDSVWALGALASAGVFVCAAARPSRGQIKLIVLSTALLVWGAMLSQGLFYSRFPRTILIEIWPAGRLFREGLNIYIEGIHHGLIQSLRMMAVMLTGYAICFTTQPDAFFRGLTAMRVPFALSFMAVTAIRFIPVVAQEFATVRRAMRLKGYQPFHNGIRDTLLTEVAGLRPILAGTIRRSEEVAVSIVTRGFAFGTPRTSLREQRIGSGGWALLAALSALTLSVTSCKILFWLYQQEVFYHSSLRWAYRIAREWL